jgi:hypothetical protein
MDGNLAKSLRFAFIHKPRERVIALARVIRSHYPIAAALPVVSVYA